MSKRNGDCYGLSPFIWMENEWCMNGKVWPDRVGWCGLYCKIIVWGRDHGGKGDVTESTD